MSSLPLTLFLLVDLVTRATAQSGAGISLEAWAVVGSLVIGVVGVVATAWVIVIVCICRIYCTFRKREKRIRHLSRLGERYGRQPRVTTAELRAVSLKNQNVSPRRQQGGQVRSTERQVESHSSAGFEQSPNVYSNYRGPTAPLNTRTKSPSDSIGIGIPMSASGGIGTSWSSSNSGGIEMLASNPTSRTRSVPSSNRTSAETGIVKSVFNSHGIETTKSPSTGIFKSSSSNTRGFPSPQPLPHSQAASKGRVVLGVKRSQLQCLSEVEEMDVKQDLSGEGLMPRYGQHLPPGVEEEHNIPVSDQRGERTRSPFTFSSERRVSERELDRTMQFNQLSSWPNFR